MAVKVERLSDGFFLCGSWEGIELANRFLAHLGLRRFSTATVRAYAFDLVNLARFFEERSIRIVDVVPTDLFDWIDWQGAPVGRGGKVVALRPTAAAPASINRRVAAVRAFFEYAGLFRVFGHDRGARGQPSAGGPAWPGPASQGPGPLGHLAPGRQRRGGRLVREQRRLPEALEGGDVSAFLLDLRTHRDRTIVLAMVLGGLRAGEIRSLQLADVDQARRQVRVVGKGGRERIVPIDRPFFAELADYLRSERPPGLSTPELAAVGIDLLVLRQLMGHVSPETTVGYVHLTNEHLAAEYDAARAVIGR